LFEAELSTVKKKETGSGNYLGACYARFYEGRFSIWINHLLPGKAVDEYVSSSVFANGFCLG